MQHSCAVCICVRAHVLLMIALAYMCACCFCVFSCVRNRKYFFSFYAPHRYSKEVTDLILRMMRVDPKERPFLPEVIETVNGILAHLGGGKVSEK